jgi:hypothetical protein
MKTVFWLVLLGFAASATPAIAQVPQAAQTLPAPEALTTEDAKREIESQLKDLGGDVEQDIRSRIDPKAIERIARPVMRRSLRKVLDVAPEVSRQAVILGEWYLGKLGDRALVELENATKKLEDLEDKL